MTTYQQGIARAALATTFSLGVAVVFGQESCQHYSPFRDRGASRAKNATRLTTFVRPSLLTVNIKLL
jgi:hypothetical protein